MELKEYILQVVKECPELKVGYSYIDSGMELYSQHWDKMIDEKGDCNLHNWDASWKAYNIKEFADAGDLGFVDVQELFPFPTDFAKFYKKVISEAGDWRQEEAEEEE